MLSSILCRRGSRVVSHLKINLFIAAIDSGQGIGTIHFQGFIEGGTKIFNKSLSQ
jgi:hypothetical protein